MVATNRTAKRRVSRHKKGYWRKGTDIADVEEHLEDERLLERTGGPIVNKANEELFVIEKESVEQSTASKNEVDKAKLLDQSGWNCFKHLQPNPLIKAAKISGPGISDGSKKRLKSKYKSSGPDKPTPKSFETARKQVKSSDSVEVYDLWVPEAKKTDLPPEVEDYTMRFIKRKTPNIPITKKVQITKLSAIEVAGPGASYNPSLPDYQLLLEKAAAVEVEKEKAEERIERKIALVVDGAPVTDATRLVEESEGLFEETQEGLEGKADGTDEQYACAAGPTTDKKKSKAQRLREKRRQEMEKTKKSDKEKKIFEGDVFRLRALKKQIREKEQKVTAAAEQRAKLRLETKLTSSNRLSKYKFEAPELEVQLPDELPASLRQLKPEGSLLEDRFKSLQKRNIIECRVRQRKKLKFQRKKFESKAHQSVTPDYKPR